MLTKLSIKNFALISSSEIEFYKGLNILSGETGSGKSIILDALNFVLGAKSDKDCIKTGENESVVIAEFDISNNNKIKDILSSFDIDSDDSLIILRKITIEGKSSIKVNGCPFNVSMLKKITQELVDIHGQSEHFYLLSNANQLELIDKYGDDTIKNIKQNLQEKINDYNDIISSLGDLGGDESSRNIRLDVLNFQIKEIEEASIIDGEEDDLIEKRKQLQNKEKIFNALEGVKQAINVEGGVDDTLSNAFKMLSIVKDFSCSYEDLYNRLDSVLSEINDIADESEKLLDDIDSDGLNIDQIEERLNLIKSLKRKYGQSFSDIMIFLENAKSEKNKLENFNELSKDLLIKKNKFENEIYSLYKDLRKERENNSERFIKNVKNELSELGFAKSDFTVSFNSFPLEDDAKFTCKNGIDEIEFLFSANVGEPVKPLSKIISGGEISRFMLGIKAQSSKYSDIGTFIFDEIDTGISGMIAKIVAKKIYEISLDKQIIAITHLPQIAVMGDRNFYISKKSDDKTTVSTINILSDEEKYKEIVRLIGGDITSSNAVNLAIEMLNEAKEYKQK